MKRESRIEQAKIRATYWNGLAIASIGVGVIPLIVGVSDGGETLVADEDIWLDLFIYFISIAVAIALSAVFHRRALRSIAAGYD